MQGNVELLAMIFIDHKVVLVPRGHIVSDDTNILILHLLCNVGMECRHPTFENIAPCSETFCTRMRILLV